MSEDDVKAIERVKFLLQLDAGIRLDKGQARLLSDYIARLAAVADAAQGVRDYSGAMIQFLQDAIPTDEHAQGVMLRAAQAVAALGEAVAKLEGE